jgi:4-diphosphocytidyl-2C-methyl-D-erythritol 2-phosphate synthase
MGGGSSDAASTLIALNRMWNLNLSRADLEHIGVQLGADVPFFIRGRNAWVEGIGEQITPLSGTATLPPSSFWVIKPEAGLTTQSIFGSPSLQRNTKLLQSKTLLQITMALATTTCSQLLKHFAPM